MQDILVDSPFELYQCPIILVFGVVDSTAVIFHDDCFMLVGRPKMSGASNRIEEN